MGVDTIEIGSFRAQIEKFKGDVEREFNKRKKKFAAAVFKKVVQTSPFQNGSYILSHRVSSNSINYNFSLFPHKSKSRAQAERQAIKDGIGRIRNTKLFESIYITNSVPHAVNVELTGWKTSPPYHVYGLTYEYMRHMVSRYMGE